MMIIIIISRGVSQVVTGGICGIGSYNISNIHVIVIVQCVQGRTSVSADDSLLHDTSRMPKNWTGVN